MTPLEEIAVIRRELEQAAEALLNASEEGLKLLRRSPVDEVALQAVMERVLTTCSFQDLAGQRLQRLAASMGGPANDLRPDAFLMHGPADGPGALDQAAADRLFRG